MNLLITADYRELSQAAGQLVAQALLHDPDAVLALPTGETPKGMYEALIRLYQEGLVDFSRATAFNLDEYLDIPPDHPQSFSAYMRRYLWDHVNLAKDKVHIPASLPEDPEAECIRYEELIRKSGGINLAVLGIGENGHIAFNEPGTLWETPTHVAVLSQETREREAQAFGRLEHVPTHAITMGIKTIMRARRVLLLASGEEKAGILARALSGPITIDVPASILQLHPNLTVVADRAAARGLAG
ncbi:glucosamine-6-phosphate deaminase [Candidatus Bipolaricaulota bacterium]|nr:glucosamine-6-phosphate deaminase [Candidatus Bipolaricaulota bacterium]